MGAYANCPECEHSIRGPWELSTQELLHCLFDVGKGHKCLGCGEPYNRYEKEYLADELAERIDKKNNSNLT